MKTNKFDIVALALLKHSYSPGHQTKRKEYNFVGPHQTILEIAYALIQNKLAVSSLGPPGSHYLGGDGIKCITCQTGSRRLNLPRRSDSINSTMRPIRFFFVQKTPH